MRSEEQNPAGMTVEQSATLHFAQPLREVALSIDSTRTRITIRVLGQNDQVLTPTEYRDTRVDKTQHRIYVEQSGSSSGIE